MAIIPLTQNTRTPHNGTFIMTQGILLIFFVVTVDFYLPGPEIKPGSVDTVGQFKLIFGCVLGILYPETIT